MRVVNLEPPHRYLNRLDQAHDPAGTLTRGAKALEGRRWWITSGTLLGLHRDGRLIPHDTDIDVMTLDDPVESLPGFRLLRTVDTGRPQQRAFVDNANDVILDVYCMWTDGDLAVNTHERGTFGVPLGLVTDLQPLGTSAGTFPAPHPVGDYLTAYYGDWQTPSRSKGLLVGG